MSSVERRGTHRAASKEHPKTKTPETVEKVFAILQDEVGEHANEEYEYMEYPKRRTPTRKNTKREITVTAEIHDEPPIEQTNNMTRQRMNINHSKLLPQDLLKIKVQVGESTLEALLDTGASNNLVKTSVCRKLKLPVDRTKRARIFGLGMSGMETEGKTHCNMTYYGITSPRTPLSVIQDNYIDSDILLGRQFCEDNKIIIDMAKYYNYLISI